jgi:transcription initiation factor TFIIIB Brf1 subunit/transcription initiation factor TFIIB
MVAAACLFFACKVEEQPRRLREFIEAIQKMFHQKNEPIAQNSEVKKGFRSFKLNFMYILFELQY